MATTFKDLSSNTSKDWKSSISSMEFNQTRRGYDGGYEFNFVHGLSCYNDFNVKEFSNFYLSRELPLDYAISYKLDPFSVGKMSTTIGSGNDLLTYTSPLTSFDYRIPKFDTDGEIFTIEFIDGQSCYVTVDIDGDLFNLGVNSNDDVIIINSALLNDDPSEGQPHVFKYMFGNDFNFLYLMKPLQSGNKIVRRTGDGLELAPLTEENKSLYNSSYFKITRKRNFNLDLDGNVSFIKYENSSNLVDVDQSSFNLTNNLLFHSPRESEYKNLIVLKNQLTDSDTFTNGNNLLSSNYTNPVNEMREYTSITNPIDTENSGELELNYVFYNEDYKIQPGYNYFTAPSSMYPFTKLNINDSKFIKGGSFAYTTPQYADKVYRIESDNVNNDGSVLLCTWLSGAPEGGDKIWVDRYYYPDLISKKDALEGKNIFDVTYSDDIEFLISTNTQLSASVSTQKIFDKTSDLVFEPNSKYLYDRLEADFTFAPSLLDPCNPTDVNYHKDINDQGKVTISFYFKGNTSSWVLESNRNDINAGYRVVKGSKYITVEYILFDNANDSFQTFTKTVEFKAKKDNFLSFSFDALNGEGYFFVNNATILDIETQVGQFAGKQLLYGPLLFNDEVILQDNSEISNFGVSSDFINKGLSFITPIIQGFSKIDDLYLTLPSGMRNSLDDIQNINSICNASANKSNKVNISLDNVGISSDETLTALSNYIKGVVDTNTPATTEVNKIDFINYQ